MKCDVCGRRVPNGRRCRRCTAAIRRYRLKLAAVKYLGGRCSVCGYDTHPAALSFHHRDGGATKDFTISHRMYSTSLEEIKPELDKCDLVCSNCHAEIHSRYESSPELIIAVFDYSGPLDFDASPAFVEILDDRFAFPELDQEFDSEKFDD